MADVKKVQLTSDEVAALRYAQDRGYALPTWVSAEGGKYYRPASLTGEEFSYYATALNLYNQHSAVEALASIKKWVAILGAIVIVGIVLAILF